MSQSRVPCAPSQPGVCGAHVTTNAMPCKIRHPPLVSGGEPCRATKSARAKPPVRHTGVSYPFFTKHGCAEKRSHRECRPCDAEARFTSRLCLRQKRQRQEQSQWQQRQCQRCHLIVHGKKVWYGSRRWHPCYPRTRDESSGAAEV